MMLFVPMMERAMPMLNTWNHRVDKQMIYLNYKNMTRYLVSFSIGISMDVLVDDPVGRLESDDAFA